MSENRHPGPLSGLKVVDLTRVLGGPFCTQWLGDLGAEIVKLEPPQGDETRGWGPPFDAHGTASYFIGVNRSKQAISIDLSQEKGREILMRLLQEADVLIENFKPGTLEKWGIGYDAFLKERYPRLVHCRISGFGADGPLGGLPGYDAIVQAMSGWMSVNGTPESGATRLGIAMVDMGTGMAAAIGILSALHERSRSGLGQFVETSLFDTALSLQFPHGSNWFMGGKRPAPTGNAHPNLAPYDSYPTGTCDIFLGCGNDAQFARLCAYLGKPELSRDERFLGNGDRMANRDALRAEIVALLAGRDGDETATELMRAGVPAGPVLGVPEVLEHPHTAHRGMVVDLPGYKGMNNPIRHSRTPSRPQSPPPRFGQHTRQVLERLGYGAPEIEAMAREGVIRTEAVKKAAE